MALDPRRVVLEAFLLANAGGPIDQAKNAVLGKVTFAFPLEPEQIREIAAEARLSARELPPRTTEPFSERVVYARACELAWEDGEIEGDRRQLDTLRHGLGLDEKLAESLLGDAQSAPPKPPPPQRTASGRTVAPPDPGPPPAALEPTGPPRFHRFSGKFSAAGLAAIWFAGLGAALVGGVVYGPLNWCIPLMIFNVLLPLALGWFTGWAVGRTARAMRMRNLWVIGGVAAACAIVADYLGFASWIFMLARGKFFVLWPTTMYQVLAHLTEKGVWGLDKSGNVSGVLLVLVWIGELVMVVACAVHFARDLFKNAAYCEGCARWYDGPVGMYVAPRARADAVRPALQAGDLRPLHGLQLVNPNSDENVQMTVTRCGGCRKEPYLTVIYRSRTNVNGNNVWNETRVVDKLAITVDAEAVLFGGK